MKSLKLFSLTAIAAIAFGACGTRNDQLPYNANTYANYQNMGWTTTGGGYGGYGQPIYSGGSLVGYKVHYVSSGSVYTVPGTSFNRSIPINQGDKVYITLQNAYYAIAQSGCSGFNVNTTQSQWVPLNTLQVSFNGSAVSGTFVASSSGNLQLTANMTPLTAHCWPSGTASVYSYYVSMGGANYYNYGSVIELDHCTNTTGAPMACP